MKALAVLLFVATLAVATAACAPTPGSLSEAGASAPGALPAEVVCDDALCLERTVSLLDLQDRPIDENVLKLFSVAADPVRNLVYVSGIMSQSIAILDGQTEQWVSTVDSGVAVRALKYLYVDPEANDLYVIEASGATLRRIDLATGAIEGPVTVGGFIEGHQAFVDSERRQLLVVTKDNGLQAFGGATFGLLYQEMSLGGRTGAMAYDPTRDLVYMLDTQSTGAQRQLHLVDPATGKVTAEIAYAAPPNERAAWLSFDSTTGRLFIATPRTVIVLRSDGSQLSTFRLPSSQTVEDVLFDPTSGKIVAMSLERPESGEVAGVGGVMTVFDPANGRVVTSVSFGRKPHQMTLNTATGKIYIPNGDASVVWSVDTSTFIEATPLRLGDSVEQVAFAGNGQSVFLSSRLGGSYLAEYRPGDGTFETFESGTWPIPVQTTAEGDRLLVLNAWDSTLSVYDAGDGHALLGTVALGLPDGSTDRLPAMAIDSSRSLAYVAYPEFGRVVVVDFRSLRVLSTITLAGFKTGDTGGGPGQIQLAVDEAANHVFVLWSQSQKLEVYDGNAGYAKLAEMGKTSLNWKLVPQDGELLFFDAAAARLFVGPIEIDAATLKPTGRTLGAGLRVFAVDTDSGKYWASATTNNSGGASYSVAVVDRQTLATLHSEPLPGTHGLVPVFALDVAHHRLYVGHQVEAELDIFSVGAAR
ncbi:MAG: PQQ-binding-like beta-propeller repeat protein [Dehalococcoidia bacterium]|nr:PQQ-binding-like beta-propeller repeat protein [Dehalococcoidia bacterium]